MLKFVILQILAQHAFSTLFASYDDILKISTTVETIMLNSEINTVKFEYHEARSVVYILNINNASKSNFINISLHKDIPKEAIKLEHKVEMGILIIKGTPQPPLDTKTKTSNNGNSLYIYTAISLIFIALGIFIYIRRKRWLRETVTILLNLRFLFVFTIFVMVSNFIPKYAEIYVIINLNDADLLPKLIINEFLRKPFCLSKKMLNENVGCISLEDYSREVNVNNDL